MPVNLVAKAVATAVMVAANVAITASQHFEGPRLQDLNGSVADYGTPLNYLYGIRRVSLPCFYCEPIKEKKKKRKGKGGKQTNYTYFGTWASAIADHEISSVRKVWFDDHLVYDATGAGEALFPLGDGYELSSFMRIYTGTETQEPDARMLATVEAANGAGTCPAYRGVSYLFFEDVPLEKIGNRFPQITAEVATVGGEPELRVDLYFKEGQYLLGEDSVTLAEAVEVDPDWPNGGNPDFDYSDVVPGVGWVNDHQSNFIRLSSAAFAAATAGSPQDGIVVIIDFKHDAEDPAYFGTSANLVDGDAFTGAGWLGYAGTDISFLADPAFGYAEFDTVATGVNQVSFRLAPDRLEAILNGGAPTTVISPEPVTADRIIIQNDDGDSTAGEIGVNPTVVERVRIYSAAEAGGSGQVTLGDICADISAREGMGATDYDYSDLDQVIDGYSWTQGTGKQILEPLLALHDSDIRPHGFTLEGIKRRGISDGSIETSEFVGQPRYKLTVANDTDLPRRIFFNFADMDADQQPNSAISQRPLSAVDSSRETSIDMTNFATDATNAKQLVDRVFRRQWFSRNRADVGLTRKYLAVEPGDVRTLDIDGQSVIVRCDKLTVGANGVLQGEWVEDDPVLSQLSGAEGAGAEGIVPAEVFTPVDTVGAVLDIPLISDAHDQTAPFVYLSAGPQAAGSWTGADFAMSDSGDPDTFESGWDGIASTDGAVFGTMGGVLPDAVAGVIDNGSSVSVVITSGTLSTITQDAMLTSGTANLAKIGDELVQFQTATLTAPLTYTLSGFVRGARGTEAAMGGHGADEQFILLDSVRIHTLGASELGDTDSYIVSTMGVAPNEADAVDLTFGGSAHRPYSPVNGSITLNGSDYDITATRRTRIGGSSVNGQDVPLGEASQSWEADIYDGATFRRTITGTSLPLTYTAAMIAADGGSWTTKIVRLYQLNPTLTLRGYPLEIT